MSKIDATQMIAQLQSQIETFKARIEVLEIQRNTAQSESVIKQAAAKVERESIVKQANAEIARLNSELKKAAAAPPALTVDPPDIPANTNGHVGEACPQA